MDIYIIYIYIIDLDDQFKIQTCKKDANGMGRLSLSYPQTKKLSSFFLCSSSTDIYLILFNVYQYKVKKKLNNKINIF